MTDHVSTLGRPSFRCTSSSATCTVLAKDKREIIDNPGTCVSVASTEQVKAPASGGTGLAEWCDGTMDLVASRK